jgi:flagella basal body P-ring formation protein FlgA
MKRWCIAAAFGIALVLASTGMLAADPIEDVITERLAADLPAGAGVAKIHLPADLADLDVAAKNVAVTIRGDLKVGRPSVQVSVRGKTKTAVWVPVTIAKLATVAIATRELAVGEIVTDADVRLESRAAATGVANADVVIGSSVSRTIAAGDTITTSAIAAPKPVARGTEVDVIAVRGAVRIRGRGVLEKATRPGSPAEVRLAATHVVARGTLTSSTTVVIGGAP